jgi:hypothetical protein
MVARRATRQVKGDEKDGEKDDEIVVSGADAKLAALVEELDVEGLSNPKLTSAFHCMQAVGFMCCAHGCTRDLYKS